jgi:hypothetical protein
MFSISQFFIQKEMSRLTNTCMSYLNKDFLLVCFVCLIVPKKILDLTRNIKNVIFFNKWHCCVVFKKRH